MRGPTLNRVLGHARKRWLLLALLAGLAIIASLNATENHWPDVTEPPRTTLADTSPFVELSNAALPAHVRPEPGRLTLFADYSESVPDTVHVYLINASPSDVVVEIQDGNPFLKLQSLNDSGDWQRAQHHELNPCAWAYGTKRLPAGHWLRYKGYQPRSGSIEPVRYALYNQAFSLASNAGWGRVNHREAQFAAADELAILDADQALLEAVVTEQVPASTDAKWLARRRLDGELIRLRMFASN